MQSPHAWSGAWQRPHHLASRFASGGSFVRYAEPRYLKWLATEPRRFFESRSVRARPDLETRSVALANGERFGPIRRANLRRLARALDAPLPAGARGPRVLWLYNPHEAALADLVPHDLLVYDIMDEYSAFPWAPPRVAEEERELLARADLVFAGTSALHDAKRPLAKGRVELVLSGVEPEFFDRRLVAERPAPAGLAAELAELRASGRRVVGYAGTIDGRVDRTLLAAAARARPDWIFVLVGPVVGDLAPLDALANVRALGKRPYAELPFHYAAWDAALVPFADDELTRHVNPTKMLEYAAADLPIVARALPDVERHYAEGAFLYRTAAEFEAALDALFAGDGPSEEARRRAAIARGWSAERSWDALAARMIATIDAALRRGA